MKPLTAEEEAKLERARLCGESELERKLALSILRIARGEPVEQSATVLPFRKQRKSQ